MEVKHIEHNDCREIIYTNTSGTTNIEFVEYINYKKLSDKAVTPYKKYDVDAGYDLTATEIIETDKYIEAKTDIAFEIPKGKVGLLFPRSSITDMDLTLKNCVGVIDASFRGGIVFRFSKVYNDLYYEFNHNDTDLINVRSQLIRKPDHYITGERVGQIVIIDIPNIELKEVDELSTSARGDNGLGSTGK